VSKPHPHLREAPQVRPATGERLDSWKEIAGYLKRDVRTVQRWEETEGLPVYRLPEGRSKRSPVYAYTSEIDAWLHKNQPRPTEQAVPAKGRLIWPTLAAVGIIAAAALFLWLRYKPSGAEAPAVDPACVVVTAFENQTGNNSLGGLGQQIADSINRALIMGVKEVKVAACPAGSGSMEFRRLAALAKSGLVVAGTYDLRDGQVELQAKPSTCSASVWPARWLFVSRRGATLARSHHRGWMPFANSRLAEQRLAPTTLKPYNVLRKRSRSTGNSTCHDS
jgi:hypothetical protein